MNDVDNVTRQSVLRDLEEKISSFKPEEATKVILESGSNNNTLYINVGWDSAPVLIKIDYDEVKNQLSYTNETTDAYMSGSPRRQDHSSLVKTFMAGLEEFDIDMYNRIQKIYGDYLSLYGVRSGDYDESFAVEKLGWMQVSVCGSRIIAYRAERWQDRILRPFFMDYGFTYIVQDKGRSYEMEFAHLYDHMDEIMELGLRKRYQRILK